MSGLLETAITTMDKLIAALNENTAARLAGGEGAAATADKPAAKRGAAKTKAEEPAGPKHTEAELVAKFEELKATDTETRMPRLKKIIADQGFASLKELRMAPAKFDDTYAALEAYEAELAAAGSTDDDDL